MIVLPFPPAELSGHNSGHWRDHNKLVATLRAEAFHIARKALREAGYVAPAKGDIPLHVRFVPPDNRGDRWNFMQRAKCQIDGVAEAMNVNDRRFLPICTYAEPEKPGRVEIALPVSYAPDGAPLYFVQRMG